MGPNAKAVSLVGDFNQWRIDSYPMERIEDSGIWWTFVPGMKTGQLYKYAIISSDGHIF